MNFKSMLYKNLILISIMTFFSFQSTTTANVEQLLKVTKTKETTEAMVKEVIEIYKKRYPNVSDMAWDSIESSINYQASQLLASPHFEPQTDILFK